MVIAFLMGIVGTVLAIIPIVSYIITRVYYRPKIFLKIGGQQSGTPIPLPSTRGQIWIGVGTMIDKETIIQEVFLQSRSNEVELNSKEGFLTITLDEDFRSALHFSGSWLIKKMNSKLFVARYKVQDSIKQFPIKILVYAKIDESEVPFPWDMILPKIHKYEFIAQFKVEDSKGKMIENLKKYGYPLEPGESIMAGYTIERPHT